jgi:hypothetical protein
VLTGDGSPDKNYLKNYPTFTSNIVNRDDDNHIRETRPLQDFFNLKDKDRLPILEWYNKYFPNQINEEREDLENQASPMLLKSNGFPITKQGSGMRATLEIFIKLFDPKIKVLCIDEPELGLEPRLQKYLFTALKEKATPDKKIILATHSHHFLDIENKDNNYICQRDSHNKIAVTTIDDLKPIIFQLLGNTLSSFLLPERILVLEGPSDTTFLNKCLAMLSKNGYSIHNSGGSGNIKYAVNSITQFLNFHKTELAVYKDKIFVIADRPTGDAVIREWEKLLGDRKRLCVLSEEAIEYYYPEYLLQSVFSSTESRKGIVTGYLKNNPNGFNGTQMPKTVLAKYMAENITDNDLDDKTNELFTFLKELP